MKWIAYLIGIFLVYCQALTPAFAQTNEKLQFTYQNNILSITNHSQEPYNLRHADIQFSYFGKIFNVINTNDSKQKIDFFAEEWSPTRKEKVYTVNIHGKKNIMLLPHKTLKLSLTTDKKDVPHHFTLKMAPTPVSAKVTVANANWVETISICNTSGKEIPLKNIEFSFNLSQPMPTQIWGSPWADWKVASQIGPRVVLVGGTAATPPLPSDPGCMNPLTIKFPLPPTSPQPTGSFLLKVEGGVPSNVGNLNVVLAAAPVVGLANPTLNVTGPNTNLQKAVVWGTTWALPNLPVGIYTITGSTVTMNGLSYTTTPINATVALKQTTSATVTYTGAVTTAVSVTLVNPPTTQVPVTLTGAKGTFNQIVANNGVLSLPSDTYNITSNVAGYNATVTPNPIVVPTNKSFSITYTPVTTGGPGSRTINFVNQCPFPVWFGIISGATPNRSGAPTCGTDADCWPSNTCVDRGAGGKHCFWKNPIPANNNFQLAANGGTNSVVIPYVEVPMGAVFSGAAAGRTNCTAAGCESADCDAGIGGCPPGKGFKQPATLAEFTFNTTLNDFYDVATVNGINIPVAMAANNAPTRATDPYYCTAPGAATTISPLGACSWDLTPTRMEFNWVRTGGAACTASTDCAAGTVCGLSLNPGKTPILQKTCGKRLGYWNANQICGEQKDYGAPFNCQAQLPAPNEAHKVFNMLGCAPIPSCYKDDAGPNCCGCVNWDQVGVTVPPAPFTKACDSSNDFWKTTVMPDLRWIKFACPTVYTYPFDDMSSTFQCQVLQNNNGKMVNSVGYTITFCPGGKTGGV